MTRGQLEKEIERERKYWEKREADLWASQDLDALEVMARLTDEYAAALEEAQRQIAAFYQKYGHDNVLEYRDMMAALSPAERAAAFRDFDTLIANNPEFAHLEDVRNQIYKLNRMESLEFNLTMRQYELGAIEQRELSAYLERAYRNGYEHAFEGMPYHSSIHGVPEGALRQTISAKWTQGLNYSERIWKNRDALVQAINKELRDGLIRGDNYQNIARILTGRFSTSASNAMRLVFTESAYVLNQANKQAFMDAGVEEYQFTAVLDHRTSDTCQMLDGQVFRFEQSRVGENYPPMHPWCRSTVVPRNYGSKAGLERPAQVLAQTGGQGVVLENLPVTSSSFSNLQGYSSILLSDSTMRKVVAAHNDLLKAVQGLELGTEAAFYYDMDMNLLKQVVGELGGGRVKSYFIAQPHIAMHNHPDGQTFTHVDILQMLDNPDMLVLNAVGNQGRVYALERSADFEAAGMYHFMENMKEKHPDRQQSVEQYLAFINEVLEGGSSYGFHYFG